MGLGAGLKGGETVRIDILATSAPPLSDAPASAPKRPRGRPPKALKPGSGVAAPATAKRPRGRPPGTGKNQKAAAAAALALQRVQELETAASGSTQLSSGSQSEEKKLRRRKSSVPVKAE